MAKKAEKIVLVDADVIAHFIVTGEILYLTKIIAPLELMLLDNVYTEATRMSKRKLHVDNWIHTSKIRVIPFPANNPDIKKEFFKIKKENPLIGDGERACMAVAKYDKNIIASSNFKDIAAYCEQHAIDYLGTLDLLVLALEKGIFDELRCDRFISEAKRKNNARFPVGVFQITDYKQRNINFMR